MKKKYLLLVMYFFYQSITACPITILNDGKTPIIASDGYNQALYIKPGQASIINTASAIKKSKWLNALFKLKLISEKLIIFEQIQPGVFEKSIVAEEKYCTSDYEKNRLDFVEDFKMQSPKAKDRYKLEILDIPEPTITEQTKDESIDDTNELEVVRIEVP